MRFGNRRAIRIVRGAGLIDPFPVLAADRAWRGEDAVDNGSVSTAWPNYWGAPLSLPVSGSGQAIKARSADLGNQFAVGFNGLAASGSFSAVALASPPTGFTAACVFRVGTTNPNASIAALTAGGTINTGVSLLHNGGNTIARKGASTDATTAISTPRSFVIVSVFDAAGVATYVSKLTAVTAVGAGDLAGTKIHIGGINDSGSYAPMIGPIAAFGYWTRALSATEAAFVLTQLGREHKVAIGS
jgi:hypothetical protein